MVSLHFPGPHGGIVPNLFSSQVVTLYHYFSFTIALDYNHSYYLVVTATPVGVSSAFAITTRLPLRLSFLVDLSLSHPYSPLVRDLSGHTWKRR